MLRVASGYGDTLTDEQCDLFALYAEQDVIDYGRYEHYCDFDMLDPREYENVIGRTAMNDNEITNYMERQGFGDYSKADSATREEMENLALEHAAREQARPSIFRELGAERARKNYENGTATQTDLINLIGLGDITKDEAMEYYTSRGWKPPKFGF